MYSKPTKSFKASEDVARNRVVELTSNEDEIQYPASGGGLGPFFLTCTAGESGKSVACVPLASAQGTVEVTAAGAFSLGDRLALSGAAGKVDDTGGPVLFVALEAATGDGEIVEAVPVADHEGLVHSETADGTTLTNTTDETTLASYTLDGSALRAGDVLEVDALVDVPSTNSTDTLTLKLKVGSEVIATAGATDVEDNDVGIIKARIVIREVGVTGKVIAFGEELLDAIGTGCTEFHKDEATEDLSGDVAVALTGEWSVAAAGNQCHAEIFNVKHLRTA